ncbi:MAG TPA: energy transducer TonB [Candidatus Omnitrophota bacterium]|nr:energy transducer TonB [Candidatus Omnitrophota bacterium]
MRKHVIFLVILFLFCASRASAGENFILDPSTGFGVQQDAEGPNFRARTDFSSKEKTSFGDTFEASKETVPPYVVAMPKNIRYPSWARREGFQGKLVVAIEILEDGNVGKWRIARSTGNEKLDQSTVESILTWKFQPAMKQGRPIRTFIEVPVNFELIRN